MDNGQIRNKRLSVRRIYDSKGFIAYVQSVCDASQYRSTMIIQKHSILIDGLKSLRCICPGSAIFRLEEVLEDVLENPLHGRREFS